MPNASTDSSRDLFTNLYTDMFHRLPQPAPEYPLSVENTGQYSQEMQAGSPDEGQDSPMYQRSVHQAEQAGRKHHGIRQLDLRGLKDIRTAVLKRLYSTKEVMPIGMESSMAFDSSQLDYIHERLNDTDIYVLLRGGRYGTFTPVGTGATCMWSMSWPKPTQGAIFRVRPPR